MSDSTNTATQDQHHSFAQVLETIAARDVAKAAEPEADKTSRAVALWMIQEMEEAAQELTIEEGLAAHLRDQARQWRNDLRRDDEQAKHQQAEDEHDRFMEAA